MKHQALNRALGVVASGSRWAPRVGWSVLAIAAGLLFACDDPPPVSTTSAPAPSAAPAAAAVPPAPAVVETSQQAELNESDFIESESNRDPFRPYIKEFLTPQQQTAKIQRKVILQRYGLDELQLIAVVAGRTNPLAMFRDPNGLGVTVKRGDYISKSAGRVKQILPDKVVVEIQEHLDDNQTMADRIIDLHPRDTDSPAYDQVE